MGWGVQQAGQGRGRGCKQGRGVKTEAGAAGRTGAGPVGCTDSCPLRHVKKVAGNVKKMSFKHFQSRQCFCLFLWSDSFVRDETVADCEGMTALRVFPFRFSSFRRWGYNQAKPGHHVAKCESINCVQNRPHFSHINIICMLMFRFCSYVTKKNLLVHHLFQISSLPFSVINHHFQCSEFLVRHFFLTSFTFTGSPRGWLRRVTSGGRPWWTS